MTQETKLKLKIGTFVTIIGVVISAIVAFSGALAGSRSYTDTKVKELRDEYVLNQKDVQDKLYEINADVRAIKTIVIDKFGQPKK